MKKSQYQIVKDQLNTNGEISRNWCLQNYISRLSAIILVLKKEGWRFRTKKKAGDYVYVVDSLNTIKIPVKIVENEIKEKEDWRSEVLKKQSGLGKQHVLDVIDYLDKEAPKQADLLGNYAKTPVTKHHWEY